MSITSKAFRLALTATALCSAAATADAKPRRVVILDFDGPRGLADTGHDAVVALLGESYDVVATKRWEDARAAAQQKAHGPATWSKAAKSSGVDAVIEGWIQDEGRHKVLTVAVREASSGNEIDSVSIKLGAKGLTEQSKAKLSSELDGVLEYIEGTTDPVGSGLRPIETRKMIGAKSTRSEETAQRAGDDDEAKPTKKKRRAVAEATDEAADEATEARPTKKKTARVDAEIEIEPSSADEPTAAPKKKDKEVATASDAKDNADLVSLFGATSDEGKKIDPAASHTPQPTPRFRIGGGGYYSSRTLAVGAEKQGDVQNFAGVPAKGLEINALVYPFPVKKLDGDLSGVGFSFGISHSAGSVVSFDDMATVSEYSLNQSAYDLGIHYRYPLADLVAIDGHVSYGHSTNVITGAPPEFETPDTDYSYLGAGANLDLNIAERASVGFGARYMYVLDVGDISSTEFYGPGRASGWGLDANFVVPLPKSLYVRGALNYEHFKIELDEVGTLTEEFGAFETVDSTVGGSLNIGIQF